MEGLRQNVADSEKSYKNILRAASIASCIGSALLAIIYFGFSYIAAFHSLSLENARPEELVSKIALVVLGEFGGIFVCFAVTLACLTTAIALTTIFAEYLQKDISRDKVGYLPCLAATIGVTFLVSTLDFTGIIKMLAPILSLCYPALIALCILNILHKMDIFQPVKTPVFIVFTVSLFSYLFL